MSQPRSKHAPAEPAHRDTEIPVVLPHVVMTIAADGTKAVTVDGVLREPESFAPPWRREGFAAILDHLTDQRRTSVGIVVHEADDITFTGIITPSKRRRINLEPETAEPAPVAPELLVLRGQGFAPGEGVLVAVVAYSDAAPAGTTCGPVNLDQLTASPIREMILLGRVSGILTIWHPA